MRRLALTLAILVVSLLTGCGREDDGTLDIKGAFYPLDLALTCDESTPPPVRSQFPASDSENSFGTICIERNSGATGLIVSKIDIRKDGAFREPVYEVYVRLDAKDRPRMEAAMRKAIHSRRTLALLVHDAVIAQAYVTSLPADGVVMIGGYGSVKEAESTAVRFVAAPEPR